MKKEFEIKIKKFIALLIMGVLCFCSCTTQRKATTYFDNHAFEGASYCESRFPVDSFFKPGKIITKSDTQYVPGVIKIVKVSNVNYDSLTNKIVDSLSFDTLKCPPSKIITINNSKVDTTGMVDKAKYKALQGENINLTQQIQNLKTDNAKKDVKIESITKGRNTWRWLGIIFMAIFATGIGTFIFSKFK